MTSQNDLQTLTFDPAGPFMDVVGHDWLKILLSRQRKQAQQHSGECLLKPGPCT